MEDFGLAKVKSEGIIVDYDDGMPDNGQISETRWIEMCYDPEDNITHIDLEPIREVIQTQQLRNGYTDDDMYLMITALANEFVPKGY